MVDGDRDEFSDYDYRDYDQYAYNEENDSDEDIDGIEERQFPGNATSAEDMLPLAVSPSWFEAQWVT